ncbi:MAG: FAD-dependent oxidoreductase, partial [Anaerolineaceae bacterium]|nr:FAD-dependent oxidoreductase [Anaerolineaceae bacterium]
RFQEGLELLLNCACQDVTIEGDPQSSDGAQIRSVKGWQPTTQTFHQVHAKYFADCSGDSVLRISGAEFRCGRESRHEFNESHAPEEPDEHTMGNTLLLQTRENSSHHSFISPPWARKFREEDLPNRYLTPTGENFWWLEVGGMGNTISQAEELRDELLKIGLGVWDLIKNHPDQRAKGWELEWIGALPGKRENVRYVGDHILTQGDVLAGGKFPDTVAYGGWTMDDHHPGGLWYRGPATIFHETPSPYGIPYRSLYSANISNLFFAGRNISASHMAISSTRVMGTCSLCGQAIGTAAALAVQYSCSPREVGHNHLQMLQKLLMDDDAYLPGFTRQVAELSRGASLTVTRGDAQPLSSGIDRVIGAADNGWWASPN